MHGTEKITYVLPLKSDFNGLELYYPSFEAEAEETTSSLVKIIEAFNTAPAGNSDKNSY